MGPQSCDRGDEGCWLERLEVRNDFNGAAVMRPRRRRNYVNTIRAEK